MSIEERLANRGATIHVAKLNALPQGEKKRFECVNLSANNDKFYAMWPIRSHVTYGV